MNEISECMVLLDLFSSMAFVLVMVVLGMGFYIWIQKKWDRDLKEDRDWWKDRVSEQRDFYLKELLDLKAINEEMSGQWKNDNGA